MGVLSGVLLGVAALVGREHERRLDLREARSLGFHQVRARPGRARGRCGALGGARLAVPLHGVGDAAAGGDPVQLVCGGLGAVLGGPVVVVAARRGDPEHRVLRPEIDLAVAAGDVPRGQQERGRLLGGVGVVAAAQAELHRARGAVGQGGAVIFQDGVAEEVTWRKTSKTSQITFTNAEGEDVPLARGQTWITAVPQNKGGGVTWQ